MLKASFWKYLARRGASFLEERTGDIDHQSVIAELAGRADISGSYLLSIVLANLIALLGLLVNSVAVVIGAMLISPLMGPIFTTGLSFAMGDLRLGRKALRNIVASIALTVSLAAILTLFSPLKDVTHEILVRTRPNVYDLLIAFFAGIAGAAAVCTRKNYLFTTTGVAVATAVIPPLSVVGYGIGTAQWSIAFGGFFLFFTNLVAIVLSSDLVFYLLRFRPALVVETPYPLRRRLQVMGVVLVLICIPLVYTLVEDIRKVSGARKIEKVLKEGLNRAEYSRFTGHTERPGKGDGIHILASVNTVKYYGRDAEKRMEEELARVLERPVTLDLEQIIVRSGNVAPEAPAAVRAGAPEQAALPRQETLAQLRARVLDQVQAGCNDLAPFVAPYRIGSCGVRLEEDAVAVLLTVRGERRFGGEEREWLRIALEQRLGAPVSLELSAAPLVVPVSFDEKGEPAAAGTEELRTLGEIHRKRPKSRFTILAPSPSRGEATLRQREDALRAYLTEVAKIDRAAISREEHQGGAFQVRVHEE